jgi:hypothetical protein
MANQQRGMAEHSSSADAANGAEGHADQAGSEARVVVLTRPDEVRRWLMVHRDTPLDRLAGSQV